MTIQDAIQVLRKSGSGEQLLITLDQVVSQLEKVEPTLEEIDF
jgi:hypothetical protein